jgi:spore coat protein U-like protein
MLGALAANVARASDSVSIALNVTVVPVCRFLTSGGAADTGRARGGPNTGSATLTYACSNGTAAAFSFTVPATTNVACTGCSGIPVASGTILATSLGIGQGLGSGRDRTLTVRTPFVHAESQETASGAYADTIIVTVSP